MKELVSHSFYNIAYNMGLNNKIKKIIGPT